ncbi:MAG: hypothetical protein KKB51_09815 [Candidatus Riflebacteria bacterium]|nr:hypothetical protein [Candidatus Riflebacteria bacterium]
MLRKIILLCIIGLLTVGCGSQDKPLARIVSVKGKVDARLESSSAFVAAQADMQLKHQGAVRTGKDSGTILEDIARKGSIKTDPDSYYEVRAGTSIGFHGSGKAVFDIDKQQTEIQIDTPHGNTAVLGTKFGQLVSSDTFNSGLKKDRLNLLPAMVPNKKFQPVRSFNGKSMTGHCHNWQILTCLNRKIFSEIKMKALNLTRDNFEHLFANADVNDTTTRLRKAV